MRSKHIRTMQPRPRKRRMELKASSLFHLDLLTTHEPFGFGVQEDEKIVTMTDRGSLSPQRGEGSRARGEITQVVENHHPHF